MAIKLSGLVSGMDTESMVQELMKAQSTKKVKLQNKITTTEWKQEKWKTLNSKIYSFYKDTLAKLKLQSSFNTKSATTTNESKVGVTASTTAPEGTHTIQVKQLATAQYATGTQLGKDLNGNTISSGTKLTDLGMVAGEGNVIKINAGGKETSVTISDTTTVGDVVTTLKNAGLNASYDASQKRFFISSKAGGAANAFTIETEGTVDLSKLGLGTITKSGDTVSTSSGMTLVQPSDAKIIYNGVEMSSTTNNISVNGLTITLKAVTNGANTADTSDDEVININIKKDTQAVYDMVKDFVKKYNELLKEMNENYDAVSARGYDPLTDEEKEAMTEDQIEKWETKIKDSLLRRDNGLGSLINNMRSSFSGSVKVGDKSYSLASFGIGSANYTEKGTLHIDGDQDDSLTSANVNKLMNAINDDPDTVMKVMNKLADNLYSSLTDSMKSTTLRSALTLYNDKEMTKSIKNYKEDLTKLESKLADMESRYYKQFSAMETAMAKMNSQSSALASMLGTNV